jgi:FLVCR family feline leukemia virus subgroup C receptor-related protein
MAYGFPFSSVVLFLGSAVVNTFIFVFIVLFFPEKPKLPPSVAQLRAIEESLDNDFLNSIKKLCLNRNYILLLITYGINVGVFYAVSTLLSQMVVHFYGDGAQEDSGTIGLLLVVSGMLGSVVCGYILDKFHHYNQRHYARRVHFLFCWNAELYANHWCWLHLDCVR